MCILVRIDMCVCVSVTGWLADVSESQPLGLANIVLQKGGKQMSLRTWRCGHETGFSAWDSSEHKGLYGRKADRFIRSGECGEGGRSWGDGRGS